MVAEHYFISYTRADSTFVEQLVADLTSAGVPVWMDKMGILPGTQNWEAELRNVIESCKAVIFVASPEARRSRYVQDEIALAETFAKPIYPVWIGGDSWIDCVPMGMGKTQYIDFRSEKYDAGLQSLFEILARHDTLVSTNVLKTQSVRRIENDKDPLDWEVLRRRAATFTTETLGIRYRAKYSSEYYSQREVIYRSYINFLNSDKTVMVITGKAGTGKSSFVCAVSSAPVENTIVWLQDCAHLELSETDSIDTYIASSLSLGNNLEVLPRLYQTVTKKGYLVLLFDAVNEFPRDKAILLSKLATFIRGLNDPFIKVVITCRIPIWDNIKRHFTVPTNREYHMAGPNSYVNMEEFSDQEIRAVYDRYQSSYGILTSFDQLSSQVKQFITQPLFLKLTSIVYRGKRIPPTLGLKDVLTKYVRHCLGGDEDNGEFNAYSSNEYQVLRRAIQLMYDHAKRELELAILQKDDVIGSYVTLNVDQTTPYTKLVNEGLLSQRGIGVDGEEDVDFMREVELVFVTYERVFEFLLAQITIGTVTTEKILELLDISKRKSFVQLRGAAELALSFAIVHNNLSMTSVLSLAHADRPESRQFLVDVIQTIYSSGHREIAEEIIADLFADHSAEERLTNLAQVLAIQASYQLKLDKYLINALLHPDKLPKDVASLYLYQRWNNARLSGQLESAYEPIYLIASQVKPLRNPQRSIQALSSLITLALHVGSHVIDDPASLHPLMEVFRRIASAVPGLEPKTSRTLLETTAKAIWDNFLIPVFSRVIRPVLEAFVSKETVQNFLGSTINKRAFLDSPMLFDEPSLIGHEDKVMRLITWDNEIVSYAVTVPLIWHLYHQPLIHLSMLEKLLFENSVKPVRTTLLFIYSLGYASIAKLLRNESIVSEMVEMLHDYYVQLWEMTDGAQLNIENVSNYQRLSVLTLVEVFTIEAFQQRQEGATEGSRFLLELLDSSTVRFKIEQLSFVVEALEKAAYQGIPEFVVKTLLLSEFRTVWERLGYNRVVATLASLRSIYQEEVDGLLMAHEQVNRNLIEDVRASGAIPNASDVLFMNSLTWVLAPSVEINVTKICGNIMLDLVSSENSEDFLSKVPQTLITAMFNFDLINITHIHWRKLHNPTWNDYEKWNIPEVLNEQYPETHKYWNEYVTRFIQQHGRGILYDEL